MQTMIEDRLGWEAELSLAYSKVRGKSFLSDRRHKGPLVVQKAFYPEGDDVCHSILVHPPGGLAGEDQLSVHVTVNHDAHALVTTPSAGKFYKKRGGNASQNVLLNVENQGILEWFPMENIIYPNCHASLNTRVRLDENALFIGWDILCLGLPESGRPFDSGRVFQRFCMESHQKPLLIENGLIDGQSDVSSPALMAGHPVTGTLWATVSDEALVERIRNEVLPKDPHDHFAITQLEGLLVGRFLGRDAFAAVDVFTRAWQIIRPVMTGKAANIPRIWRT